MKNSIVIGPIQKAKPQSERSEVLKDRLAKMKVGHFFDISGISSKSDVNNIRASICYISKKQGVRVATQLKGDVMRVERIKSNRETKAKATV